MPREYRESNMYRNAGMWASIEIGMLIPGLIY